MASYVDIIFKSLSEFIQIQSTAGGETIHAAQRNVALFPHTFATNKASAAQLHVGMARMIKRT